MKLKKYLRIILPILTMFYCLACNKGNDAAGDTDKPDPLTNAIKLEVITDKQGYDAGDEIRLSFKINNISAEPVNLNAAELTKLSDYFKIGIIHDNKISYIKAEISAFLNKTIKRKKSLLSIKPGDAVGGIILLRVNPIRRLTDIPYSASALFITYSVRPEDYPKGVQVFYNKVTGEYSSNETKIRIASTGYEKRFEQYDPKDYAVSYHKLTAPSTDILVLDGFDFNNPDGRLTKDELKDTNYVRVFKDKSNQTVFMEFYVDNRFMKYAKLLRNKNGGISDFLIYYKNGLIDMRYEVIRDESGKALRWDRYAIDLENEKDIYLGYLKISTAGEIKRISELLVGNGKTFKRFIYNDAGKVASREEVVPPVSQITIDRKY